LMGADKKFIYKWTILAVSLAIIVFPVFNCAAAQENALVLALSADPTPRSTGWAMASRQSSDAQPVAARRTAVRDIEAASVDTGHLMPKPDAPGGFEAWPRETAGAASFYQELAAPLEFISSKGGTQPLLGIGWDRDAGGLKKWNISLGFGFYFSDSDGVRSPTEDFGSQEPVPAERESDLFEKIRAAVEVFGFKVRYDF